MKHTHSAAILLSALLSAAYASALLASEPATDPTDIAAAQAAVDEKCHAPKWAIAIGHEDKWKLHNGCDEAKARVAELDTPKAAGKKPEIQQ